MRRVAVLCVLILGGCGRVTTHEAGEVGYEAPLSGVVYLHDYDDQGLVILQAQFFEESSLPHADELESFRALLAAAPIDVCIAGNRTQFGVASVQSYPPNIDFMHHGEHVELESQNQFQRLVRSRHQYLGVQLADPTVPGWSRLPQLNGLPLTSRGDSDWWLHTSSFDLALPDMPYFRLEEPAGSDLPGETRTQPWVQVVDHLVLRWDSDSDAPVVLNLPDRLCVLENDGEHAIPAEDFPTGAYSASIEQIHFELVTTDGLPQPVLVWMQSLAAFWVTHEP